MWGDLNLKTSADPPFHIACVEGWDSSNMKQPTQCTHVFQWSTSTSRGGPMETSSLMLRRRCPTSSSWTSPGNADGRMSATLKKKRNTHTCYHVQQHARSAFISRTGECPWRFLVDETQHTNLRRSRREEER